MKMYLKNVFRKPAFLILGLFMALGFSSCLDEEDEPEVIPTAYVSLYHASPNSSGLKIFVDNRQVNSYPFDYSENTGYLRFYTGERQLKFTPYDANNSVIDTTANFEPGSAYSVFVTGTYPDVDALILKDDSERPTEGNAKLRIVHLAPDAAEVDLLGSESEDPIANDQSYKSASDFTEISAGTYDFDINGQDGSTLLDVDDINLSSGYYYTLVLKGYANPPEGNERFLSAEVIVN